MVKTAKKECVKDKIIHISTGFFPWVFSNFGKNTVVQTVVSPNEKYYALVIDSAKVLLAGILLLMYIITDLMQLFFRLTRSLKECTEVNGVNLKICKFIEKTTNAWL